MIKFKIQDLNIIYNIEFLQEIKEEMKTLRTVGNN